MAVYAMVGYSPSLLDDDYFKEFAVSTGFMPVAKTNKMCFSVKNIPNWADHAVDIVREVRERYPKWELDPADATWLGRPDNFVDRSIRYQAMREYAKIVYERCMGNL